MNTSYTHHFQKRFDREKKRIIYHWTSKEFYYHLHSKFSNAVGVLGNRREVPLIVSLTSTPDRIRKVYLCIETLLCQSLKPDEIILWLPDTIGRDDIPKSLQRLENRGLHIRLCRDIGPHTKLIYALKENPKSVIVTADDDVFYPGYWLEKLYKAYLKEPQYIHCYRAHLMISKSNGMLENYSEWGRFARGIVAPSFFLFPTGNGGVLYPPGSLNHEVFNEKLFTRLCPTADDAWFKAMSLLNGVACKKVTPFCDGFMLIKGTQANALYKRNREQNLYDEQIQAVFNHYNLHHSLRASSAYQPSLLFTLPW